jgi:hypothetical protein
LGYFNGAKSRQIRQYREYVEGNGVRSTVPEVRRQIFVGDEGFVEAVRLKAKRSSAYGERYSFQRLVEAVSGVMGVNREEIRRAKRSEEVQRSREMLCYLARDHGEVGLQELTKFLRVKEQSTASHAIRRAEGRIKEDSEFSRQVERVLRKLIQLNESTSELFKCSDRDRPRSVPPLVHETLTSIFLGLASSAFGRFNVNTPCFSSARILV